MKKSMLIAMTILSFAIAGELKGETDWETLPVAPRDDETSEWWANTWHPGDVVPMVSRYQFEGRLCIRKKDLKDVRWYQFAKRFLETEQAVRIDGVARCTTSVLDAPDSNTDETDFESETATQLIRAFHSCPISGRAVGVVGLKDGINAEKSVRKALIAFYEELQSPEVQEAMDICIKCGSEVAGISAGVKAAALAVAAGHPEFAGPVEEAARRLTKLGVEWVGRKTKEIVTDRAGRGIQTNQKVLKGSRFESYGDSDIRGAEVKTDSWFYQNLDKTEADGVTNIAVTINALFDNGRFYLAGAPGETILAKRLIDAEGEDGEAFRVFCKGIADTATLYEKMENVPLTPSDYRVSNIFARETLNVNATLFDLRERKIGDVWRADGALLNNFLHPDLEGRFEGIVFLQYKDDEAQSLVSFPEAKDKVFQTRHLVMLPRHMGQPSRLSYRENGFRMDYDPDTQDSAVSVWVDKETGHVVKVEARVDGNVAALSNLALFKGFSLYDSAGRLHFEMSAEANPSRFLSEIKE